MNLDKILQQIQDNASEDFRKDLKEDLKEVFKSRNASSSADKINKLFKDMSKKNKAGGVMKVADPAPISDQIEETDDGLLIRLTEEQRRFLAADKLFGDDSIGLKYTE